MASNGAIEGRVCNVPSMFPVCSQFCSQSKFFAFLCVPSVPSICVSRMCEGCPLLTHIGFRKTGGNTGNWEQIGVQR